MKLMSSSTCSRGSPPRTSMRSRAGPATISSDSCSFGRVGSHRFASSASRLAMFSLTSWKCRSRPRPTASRVAGPQGLEDRRVQVGRPLRVGAGHDQGDVGPGEGLERPPDLLERAHCRRARRSCHETWRRPRRGEPDVPGAGRVLHRRDGPASSLEGRVGQARDGQPSRQRLQAPSERCRPREAPLPSAAARVRRETA